MEHYGREVKLPLGPVTNLWWNAFDHPGRSALAAYSVALGSVLLATVITLPLRPALEPSLFPLYTAAVMISAWFGGLGPGLAATIVAVFATEWFFTHGAQSLRPLHGTVRVALFALVALLISSLTAARKRAEAALREAHAELELRVKERTAELAAANDSLRIEIGERERAEQNNRTLLHDLGERVKELTALHAAAHLLQGEDQKTSALLRQIVELIPAACQEPGLTAACIEFTGRQYKTVNFADFQCRHRSEFATSGGKHGFIEVGSIAAPTRRNGHVFCPEEKRLVESLAEMLRSYFQRREAADQVAQVSRELIASNRKLWRLQGEMKRVEPLAALGQVTGTIAHELGTPLNSVLGYTQLLGQDELSDNGRRRLEIIRLQVERMVGIINSYLFRVRSSYPKQQRVDINALIQETIIMFRPILQQHGVKVETDLASDLPALFADGPSLQRVLVNLLDNALDAMQREGGTVEIATRSRPASASMQAGLTMTVSDTGSGIPDDVLPKVFEMFVTTKAPGEGSGLGLAITQEIIKGHDGDIQLVSEIGRGTTVTVFLPAGPCPATANN